MQGGTALRILLVSSYPPRHCGVGSYAHGQAGRLREEGHEVTVLSPPDGEGDVRVPFENGRPFFRAARIGGRFDRIVVQFQPSLYYPPRRPVAKVLASLGMLWLAVERGRRLELVVHEADPPKRWRPDYLLLAWAFAKAGRVSFHTRAEWQALERDYRIRVRGAVIEHRIESGPRTERDLARQRLGIGPGDGPVFVCAGFLQPSKGFDRAVEAMAANGSTGARLYIVGSIREDTAENRDFVRALRERAREVPGVTVEERFLPGDEFDLWVSAADWLVIPYRRSWSSGMLARAHALGVPAIVAAVGGLAEQAGAGDTVVQDDEGLRRAFRQAGREALR